MKDKAALKLSQNFTIDVSSRWFPLSIDDVCLLQAYCIWCHSIAFINLILFFSFISFLSPPLHDPYFSMWTPDLLFPPGMFNPYSMFMGSNGHRPEVPTTTSMSSFCSVPSTGGLPFVTPHRPPHSMPYPILDSYVPHPSPKESPSLPYSCKTNSRKRGPAEADTACALDLTTKRTKLECSKNDYFTSPASRTESADNCKKSALLNLSKAKTPDGDKSNTSKTHSNAHRHKKSIHSIWQEKDSKGQILQCKCGADNPENIMNWSAEKVFDFVSKLEGCSSYAKVGKV